MNPDDFLEGQDKPTIQQVAWVFAHLYDHIEGGTFRYLIYNRMGFGVDAYVPLYTAGGMVISDSLGEVTDETEA